MSISNQTARAQFIADGVNNSYVVPFKFLENSPSISGKVYQLKVFIGKAGKDTELLEGTNYSVQASTDNRITIFNAYGGNEIPRVGDVISILRDVPLNQNIELEEKHKFPVKVIEQGFDKNTMAIQEIKEKIDRAPLLPLSSPITPEEYQQSFFTARDEALESAAAAKSAATDAKNSAQEAADSVKNKMDRISADDQTQVVGTNLALAKDKEFLCTDKDGRQHNAASIGIYGDYQQFESGTEEVPYCLNHHAAPDGNIHPVANIKDNAGQIITDNLALVSDVTALDEAALKVADKITSIGSDSTDDDIPTGKATFNLVAASRNGLFLGGYWFGKTTEDFVPPVTEDMAGKNYFDFINNTAYTFDLANLTWVVKEAFTPKDTALVRITKVFWDLSADAGKPGYATYSEHSASWAYSPNTGGDSNPPDMETIDYNALGQLQVSKRIAGSFNTETAASGTAGRQYNVNISNYTPQVGDKITIIPHITSTSEGATLCINNGVGYQFRRTNSAYGNYFDSLPYASSFLRTALPVSLIFTGSSWGIDVTKPHGEDILGIVRVKSGGTGRNEIPANSAMFGDGTNPLKLVTPNPETDDGKTLVFSKTEGWKLANASSAKAMGEVYASLSNLDSDNPGAVLLSVDSATSGKYLTPTSSGYSADFYNWLKTKHAERITTKTNYDTAIANFGRCELYVLDEEPGSIRYPLKPAKKIRALIDKKTETIQTSDPAAPATLKWELYSDGWCKQLFNITNIGDRQITVPFKFAMQDNDYFALRIGGAYGNNNANVRTTFNVKNGDLTSIDIWNYGGYNAANALYIEGYSSDPLPEEYNNSNELLYYWVSVANAQIEKSVQFVNQEGPLRDIEDLKDATGFSTTGFNNLKNMDAPDYAAAEVIFDNTALLVTTELSWTATKDGYISFNAYGFNGAEAYLRVNGTEIAQGSTTSSSHISACAVALAKVSAGDIVTCKNAYATSAAYLRRFLKFIPYKG